MEEPLYHGVCVCLSSWFDAVVQCCSNSVMHLCLWMVMHSLDIHAWLAVTGKIDASSKLLFCAKALKINLFLITCVSENILEVTMILGMIWLSLSPIREVRGDKLAWLRSCTRSFIWTEVDLEGMENYILARFCCLAGLSQTQMLGRTYPWLCKLQETEGNSCIYLIPIVLNKAQT